MNKINEQKIIEAIRIAEKSTSAEIVPIIVKRSSTIGHVPLIVFLIFIILFLEFGSKNIYCEIVEFFVSLLAAHFLAKLSFVQRFLTSNKDQRLQTHRRAEFEFYNLGMQKTKKATGVLIFVSLMERKAVILADKTISDKLPENTWAEALKVLIAGIKSHNVGEGIIKAIEHCSKILNAHFPPDKDNPNEIADKVFIKE